MLRTTTKDEVVDVTTDGTTAMLPARAGGRAHLMLKAASTNTDTVLYRFGGKPTATSLYLAAGEGIVLSSGAPSEALHVESGTADQKLLVLEVV